MFLTRDSTKTNQLLCFLILRYPESVEGLCPVAQFMRNGSVAHNGEQISEAKAFRAFSFTSVLLLNKVLSFSTRSSALVLEI
jgi:hypothetical protein